MTAFISFFVSLVLILNLFVNIVPEIEIVFLLSSCVVNFATELNDTGQSGDHNELNVSHSLFHHGIKDLVRLWEHGHETLYVQEQEIGQAHARTRPLTPPSIIVVPVQDHDVGNNDARTIHNVSMHPKANSLPVFLQVVLTREQENDNVDKY